MWWVALTGLCLLCICWCSYAHWRARQPWPDFGGSAVDIHTYHEWLALLESAGSEGKLVLVDFYAIWCPPCRSAAPTFARMSEQFPNVRFAKVNVEVAREVAAKLEVYVMPTFHLFRANQKIGSVRGWNERALRSMLEEHGALFAPRGEEPLPLNGAQCGADGSQGHGIKLESGGAACAVIFPDDSPELDENECDEASGLCRA